MKDLHFNISMFLALSMSGLCASGCSEDGGDSVTGTRGEAFGVTITSPSSEPTYSTVCNSVFLSGAASVYSGDADALGGITVTWSNQTTGTSGLASSTLEWCDFLGYPYVCGLHWTATVPLAVGDNLITVTATDPSNRTGHRSMTVSKPILSYSVSGKAVSEHGIGLWGYGESGIKIALAGAGTSTYQYTEQDGSYSFSCVVNGSYNLTLSSPINYTFSPVDRPVTVTDADVTGQDFSAEAYLISGQVTLTYSDPFGVTWVQITLTGANSSATYSTGSAGGYSFLVPNGTYTVEPHCVFGCSSFTPANRTVTIDHGDVLRQDFAATTSSTPRALPARAPD